MSTPPERHHSDVWRWLAAFLAGVVLAGMPAAFISLSAPGRSDYDQLRAEVVNAQLQLARIEERLVSQDAKAAAALTSLDARLAELRALIERKP